MSLKSAEIDVLKFSKTRLSGAISLSRYFPKGTYYFYGYPSGEDSGFLNKVPPAVEELVSARPLVCAGPDINVISFAQASRPDLMRFVGARLGMNLVPASHVVTIPAVIDTKVEGTDRNESIKRHLRRVVPDGRLVMAQPFLDEDIRRLYQISPKLTNWLNDKQNLAGFVPHAFLAERHATYADGRAFTQGIDKLRLPCVVKVSSSSAGDGVYICKKPADLRAVMSELKDAAGTVIVEEYIDATANHGIQFGVPEDPSLPIEIIGISEQLTTEDGEFIGGIINTDEEYKTLQTIKKRLLSEVLPHVRQLGWYGVGCFDVLTDRNGRHFIIDCNFRMTGMTAYLMLAANGQLDGSLVSFNGEYSGSLEELQRHLERIRNRRWRKPAVSLITLTEQDGVCRFNAALSFDGYEEVGGMAARLLRLGIVSPALTQLV